MVTSHGCIGRAARLALAAAITLASLGGLAAPALAQAGPNVTVMTRNVFLGGNLTPSINASTVPAFLAANAALLSHVDLVDFPARAKLLAEEITEHGPDLVGLQEVATWRTGPINNPAEATDVRYDYLALLTAELSRSGHPYDVAVEQAEYDLEGPAGEPHDIDVRLTLRDVILVRHGGRTKVNGSSVGHFAKKFVLPPRPPGGTADSKRGWTAVDVVHGPQALRFVNTHLEAFDSGVRVDQAQELLAGPLRGAPGDVIVAGDMNTGPDMPDPDNRAYSALVAGGMQDTWAILHPSDPGYTAGLGADLTQPADSLEHRIDIVMFRGALKPVATEVFGTERQTPAGRWASDHLGYLAVLALP